MAFSLCVPCANNDREEASFPIKRYEDTTQSHSRMLTELLGNPANCRALHARGVSDNAEGSIIHVLDTKLLAGGA